MANLRVTTPHREVLRISETRSIFTSLFLPLLLLPISVYMFFETQGSRLSCVRQSPTQPPQCELTRASLTASETLIIGSLIGSAVEDLCDEGCTYRTIVETTSGFYPLSDYYSSFGRRASFQIENYLSQPSQVELMVSESTGRWIAFSVGLFTAFFSIGNIVLFFFRSSLAFDKRTHTLRIYQVGLFKHQLTDIPLDLIRSIRIEKKGGVDSDGDEYLHHGICLLRSSQDPIWIAFSKDHYPFRLGSPDEAEQLAHQIGSFLGLPISGPHS